MHESTLKFLFRLQEERVSFLSMIRQRIEEEQSLIAQGRSTLGIHGTPCFSDPVKVDTGGEQIDCVFFTLHTYERER